MSICTIDIIINTKGCLYLNISDSDIRSQNIVNKNLSFIVVYMV